jgi:hypothetical protein
MDIFYLISPIFNILLWTEFLIYMVPDSIGNFWCSLIIQLFLKQFSIGYP